MSQNKIILVIVAVVAVVGLWFVFLGGADKTGTETEVMQSESDYDREESDTAFDGVGSFAALMGLGKDIRCEFAYSDESGSGSGTSYFAEERMRVDSTQTFDGETMISYMINDGEFVYTWTEGGSETFAMKMPVGEFEDDPYAYADMPTEAEQSMVTNNQEVEYDCDPWRVDESVFVPPSDVEFMDMQAMFDEMMQGMPEGFEMPEGMPMLR